MSRSDRDALAQAEGLFEEMAEGGGVLFTKKALAEVFMHDLAGEGGEDFHVSHALIAVADSDEDDEFDGLAIKRFPGDRLAELDEGEGVGVEAAGFAVRDGEAVAEACGVFRFALPDGLFDETRVIGSGKHVQPVDGFLNGLGFGGTAGTGED